MSVNDGLSNRLKLLNYDGAVSDMMYDHLVDLTGVVDFRAISDLFKLRGGFLSYIENDLVIPTSTSFTYVFPVILTNTPTFNNFTYIFPFGLD